jgi:hypothetical protein
MTPTEYRAIYRDAQGEIATLIENDGKTLRMRLANVEFTGTDFDGFEVVGSPDPGALSHFRFASGSLCACSLDLEIPARVLADSGEVTGVLQVSLKLGGPAPNGGVDEEILELNLSLGDRRFPSRGFSGWFEDELLDIQKALPQGWHLKMCFGCAFSDYSPGGHGLFGCLACFRDNKSGYLAVRTKADYWPVLKTLTESVQETYLCPEFEVRKPGTVYRG